MVDRGGGKFVYYQDGGRGFFKPRKKKANFKTFPLNFGISAFRSKILVANNWPKLFFFDIFNSFIFNVFSPLDLREEGGGPSEKGIYLRTQRSL